MPAANRFLGSRLRRLLSSTTGRVAAAAPAHPAAAQRRSLSTKEVKGQWPLTGTILLTGACGQVGQELLPALREAYGAENVIGSDVRKPPPSMSGAGPFETLDVTNAEALARIVAEHRVDTIVHLAALLSATGEKNPQLALAVNNMGVTNVLEAARINNLRVFSPSTIAVFGPSTPKDNTPDQAVMRPTTIYGVTKVGSACLSLHPARGGEDTRQRRKPAAVPWGQGLHR
jgi:threonine 3-dehydrogenase